MRASREDGCNDEVPCHHDLRRRGRVLVGGSGLRESDAPRSRPASSSTPVTAPATPVRPAEPTGSQLCGLFNSNDLAPLVYGDTTRGPTAESSGGLAGCRWPVSGSRKDFAMFLDKESGGNKRENYGEFAQVTMKVGGQQLVRTTTGATTCDAVVYGPQVPAFYYLRVKYEADKSVLKGQDPCKPTLSAVGVVLTKLGWSAT
ncbi:DUF3558 family protein [Williamsia deligens]|nr:DUF3558 family protein [Williamsia deligens]